MTILTLRHEVEGLYRLRVGKVMPDGSEVYTQDTGWFKNLIVDQGLNRMGANNDWLANFQVGSGNTPPANTDTSLQTFVANTTTLQSQSNVTNVVSSPFYAGTIITRRFGVGVAAGNLSEVGVGWTSGAGTLFSRALIVDGGGVPTTITVLSDEFLDVTYQFRWYSPPADVVGVVTISAINYNYTLRPAAMATFDNPFQESWGTQGGSTAAIKVGVGSNRAFNGALGLFTGTPAGTTSNASSVSSAAYGAGTLFRDVTTNYDLNAGNLAGGIRCLTFSPQWCSFQVEFSPVLPKDNTKILSVTFRHTWARRP